MPTQMMPRLSSAPVELHWLGWRSNTYTLQQYGWQMSVDERMAPDHYDKIVRVALKYNDIIGYFDFSYSIIDPYQKIPMQLAARVDLSRTILFKVADFRPYFRPYFEPVDALPTMQDVNEVDLRKISWFRPVPQHEVIVKQPSYDELMDQVLALQAPKQKELREKAREQSRIIVPDLGTIIRVAA